MLNDAGNEADWIRVYEKAGALWIHDGNPKRPHALLTSGKHSNGFFNSELVMEHAEIVHSSAVDLFTKLRVRNSDIGYIDRVVGPAMGAITLAHEVSNYIDCYHQPHRKPPCKRAYTEKSTKITVRRNGEQVLIEYEDLKPGDVVMAHELKSMVFKKTSLKPHERVLIVEDVLTTGGSIERVAEAVIRAQGEVLPYVGVLVNRSGLSDVQGREIVALINRPMPSWDPLECPLCKEGSEAIRPKGNENWTRLNASY